MRLSLASPTPRLPPPSAPRGPPPSPDLRRLNSQRLSEDARVLKLLGAVCTLGATVGGLGATAAARMRTRAFFQAAASVHVFVLGTALLGGRAVKAQELPRLGLRTTLRRSSLLQRLLWVGLGLDVATAALGAMLLLQRRGHTAWREGAGASLLLHGGALLIFDAGLFWRNAQHHRRVAELGRTSSGQVVVTKNVPPEPSYSTSFIAAWAEGR
ncbi:DUF6992 family protein [Hyalangium rubrum]|uniref:Uncharacterized protein n=1 Tax=Hyalangium rubrum TaxID=3103134 RepID=A0ABU5GW68_9BACT|nr:hypothetical protein [Hyalangium sp. s54d21]MDY7224954.1 hypothetical protein [Hyalangium sp. s54d21]